MFAIYLSFLSSCTEPLELVDRQFQNELIVQSLLKTGDSIDVTLLTSIDPLQQQGQSFGIIGGANLILFENGIQIGAFRESENQGLATGYYSIDHLVNPGSIYSIEIETEEFGISRSQDIVPDFQSSFELINARQFPNTRFSKPEKGVKFTLTILDSSGPSYYEIGARYEFNEVTTSSTGADSIIRVGETLIMESSSLLFEDYFDRFMLDDQLFDGKKVEIDFEGHFTRIPDGVNFADAEAELVIEVREVSESYYLYYESVELQRHVNGDPFAEPVEIFTNVENGLGIVASYTATTLREAVVE